MAHTSIRKALPWAVIDTATSGASTAIGLVILSRLLSTTDFGVIGLAQATVGLVGTVATSGIRESIIRHRPTDLAFQDSAHWLAVLLNLAGFAVCGVIAAAIAWRGDDTIALAVLAFGAIGFVSGFSLLPDALLTRKMRTAALAKRTMLSKAVYIVSACGLAIAGFGLWSIVIASALQAITSTIALWSAQPRRPKLRLSLAHARGIVSYGWAILAETLLWAMTGRVFTLLIGSVHGVATLGYVTFAMKTTDVVSTLLSGVYSKFGLSLFSQARHSSAELSTVFVRFTEAMNVVSAPIFVGMALTAQDWVPIVFGAKWEPAIPMTQVLCVAWALIFTRKLAGDLVRASGHPRALLPSALVAGVTTCLSVFITKGLPMVAVVYGWAARIPLTLPIGISQVQKYANLGWAAQLRPLLRPALGCAAMAAVVLGLQAAMNAPPQGSLTRLVGSVLLGATTYGAVVAMFFRQAIAQEVRKLRRAR
jgi:O-antigen/teichoic acid export membrane protein